MINKGDKGDAGDPGEDVGGNSADPTKNVLDLVKAESKYQDAMREAETRIFDAETKRRDELAEAEARRINDLAALRYQYDTRIAEDLRVGVKTTSEQLASQLIKETGSLSNLIGALRTEFASQVAALTTSFTNQLTSGISALTPRLADLERFRWESGGKTSVSDPAMADALTKMNRATAETNESIARLTMTLANMQSNEGRAGGVVMGRDAGNARLLAVVMAVAAIASPVIAILVTLFAVRGGVH